MSPAPPRRLLLAFALSLGVHALVWLVLEARARKAAAPRPSPAPVTLELVEVEVTPAPPKLPEPSPPPRAPPPPSRPPPKPITEAPPPPPPPKPAPPALPEATAQAPTSDVPRADLPRADVPRLAPNLGPPLSLTPGGEVAVSPRDAGVPSGVAAQNAQQIVSNLALESLGKGKVERGLVHPYFSQLGKSLLKAWDAERAVSSQGFKGFLEQAQENSKAWNSIWRDRAAAYGASGSPLEEDASLKPNRRPPPTVGGNPNLEARRAMRQQMREEFRATRRAIIRVVQDTQGQLLEVTLVSPSNNAQVDREAIKDVRAAAEQLPPPPLEALAGKQTLTSLWQFELIISITPPVPTLSFEFDEALQFMDMRLPLDRRIYKRVRLLSVQ
ncbi:MAG: TonB C-terminal domain-containing protein [Myxococcaceae bacterium]|nr:TonB C-terminal domain-containing protein [Myxococcaceae bacterium]